MVTAIVLVAIGLVVVGSLATSWWRAGRLTAQPDDRTRDAVAATTEAEYGVSHRPQPPPTGIGGP